MNISDSTCIISFSTAMSLFASGVVLSLVFGRISGFVRIGGNLVALGASIAATFLGLCGLAGARFQLRFAGLFPSEGILLGLDRLSAFFVLIVGVGGGIAAIYAIGYTRGYEGGFRIARMTALLNLFLATMVLVPLAGNALTFLFLWELMSLASFLLVMTEAERAETRKAGWIYLVMTHIGFACLVLGFFLLAHGVGSTEFTEWNRLSGELSQGRLARVS